MSEKRRGHSVGVIGWVRRRIVPPLARLSALLGLVIAIAWVVGRVQTDRYLWSQYLWWVPPIWMLGSAWVLLGVSALLNRMARRMGGLLLRPLLLVLATGCTLYLVFGVWHMQRALGSGARAPGSIRVLHWNQSAYGYDQARWGKEIMDTGADIVLITNASWGEPRQELLDQFAPFAPVDRQRWVNYSYRVMAEPSHFRVEGSALVASRFPMTRTGMVHFGTSERQQVLSHSSSNLGWVMFIEIDLTPDDPTDAPLVVWFVDMPSNPARSRQEVMREARGAIGSWDGRGWTMGRHVWEQSHQEDASFPEPDLIMGDFNTPRGSDSLGRLAPGMKDAFAQAGYGRAGTWHFDVRSRLARALGSLGDWHIDLALTGPGWEANGYRLIDPGTGPHEIQMVDMVRSDGY